MLSYKRKKRQIKGTLKEFEVYLDNDVINMYDEESNQFNKELNAKRQRLKKYIRVFFEEQETSLNLNEEN